MSTDSPDPLIGRELSDGRYVIESRIGAGGMGAVYLGHQRAVDRPVAIKVIHGDLSKTARLRARFHREAHALAGLQSPHCVTVHDFGETEDGLLYIVMERLIGRTLAAYLHREGRLPIELFMRFMRQICSAVHAAHSAGLVHRDLKPDNIFLQDTPDGPQVKILDFGLVKLLESTDDPKGQKNLTRPGQVFGTPMYMSPEQALGQEVDERADLYAMGLIAYECLSGQPAFAAPTPQELLMAHVTRAPPKLEFLRADAPPQVVSAINVCLAKPAADRYATALDFLADLESSEARSPDGAMENAATANAATALGATANAATANAATVGMPDAPALAAPAPTPIALTPASPTPPQEASTRTRTWLLGAAVAIAVCAIPLFKPLVTPSKPGAAAMDCDHQPPPAYGASGAPCWDDDTTHAWSFSEGLDGRRSLPSPLRCRAPSPEATAQRSVSPPLARAVSFTGEGESRIECESTLPLSAPFTLEAWVRPRLTPERHCHQVIMGSATVKGGAARWRCKNPRLLAGWTLTLMRQADDVFAAELRTPLANPMSNQAPSPTIRAGQPVAPDVWTHLAVVNDGQKLTFLVNGRSTVAPAPAMFSDRPAQFFTIGGHSNASDGVLVADVAAVRVSAVARDPAEIKAAYGRARALLR